MSLFIFFYIISECIIIPESFDVSLKKVYRTFKRQRFLFIFFLFYHQSGLFSSFYPDRFESDKILLKKKINNTLVDDRHPADLRF